MAKTLLVVDDEPEVLDGLVQILKTGTDLHLLSTYDPETVLSMLATTIVDVILADIRMPGISGHELKELVQKQYPKIRFIFLSGVRDFDYVYRAVQDPQARYLAKTESDVKIVQTVLDVFDEIEATRKMQDTLSNALPLLQQKALLQLIKNADGGQTQAVLQSQEMAMLQKSDDPLGFICLYISHTERLHNPTLRYLRECLANRFTAISKEDELTVFAVGNDPFVFIFMQHANRALSSQEIYELLQQAQKDFTAKLHYAFIAVFDAQVPSLGQCASVYTKVQEMMPVLRMTNGNRIINSAKFRQTPGEVSFSDKFLPLDENRQALQMALELGQRETFIRILKNVISPIALVEEKNDGTALWCCEQILQWYRHYLHLWKLEEQFYRQEGVLGTSLFPAPHSTWADTVQSLVRMGEALLSMRMHTETDATHGIVRNLQNYIRNNLEKDLSLVALGKQAGFNPSYLSRVFKEITGGVSLSEYILRHRMHKAGQLLVQTNDRINDIAQKAGYHSSRSFIRIFHRFYSCTPIEYRNTHCQKRW